MVQLCSNLAYNQGCDNLVFSIWDLMFTPHRTSTHILKYYRYESIMVTTNMCNNPSNDSKNDDSSVGVSDKDFE